MTDNVVRLSRRDITNIPESLRDLADAIEKDGLDIDKCIIVPMRSDGSLSHRALGPDPFSPYEAIGMLQIAIKQITDSFDYDD